MVAGSMQMARRLGTMPASQQLFVRVSLVWCRPNNSRESAAAGLPVNDIAKAAGVVADLRKVFRQDTRIIQKLHRRVFLDKITPEQVRF